MRKLFTLKFLVIALLVFSVKANSQIAAWDFTGENQLATSTADLFNANLDASNLLTRGVGAAASAGANSFRTVGFQNNGISTSNTDYFEFTLSAASGYALSLSTIDAKFAGTATFAASPGVSSQFAYSLDGTNFTLIGSPSLTTGATATLPQINLSGIAALQNVPAATTVTFRYYASGQTTTGGWGFNSPAAGNYGLAIGGTLTSAANNNANLSNLSISPGLLNETFNSSTTAYTASVANSVSSITVTPTSADASAVIKVGTATVASGTASPSITLNEGSNTITVLVTASDGTTTKSYTINVTRAAAGTPSMTASALTDFGNVCINTTAGPNSFTLSGNNLDGSNSSTITLSALTGFSYSLSAGGPFTNTLSFTYTGNSFTDKVIYVQFNPTAVQSYNGDININGGGITNYPVAAKGAGVNTNASVTTVAGVPAGTGATLNGTITDAGCSAITGYGFEYSVNTGFANGTGTPVTSSNLSGGNFSAAISGLQPNRRYYYKAFVTTSAGTSYGTQQAFNALPSPVIMSAQPSYTYTETFADIANWGQFFVGGIGAEHFSQAVSTSTGTIPNAGNVTANTVFNSGVSGGVQMGTTQVTPTQSIVLLSTGSSDNTSSAAFDLYLDFTGVNAGTLSFDWETVFNSTGDRNGSLRVYGTTDGTTFTELPFAAVLNFTNNVASSGSKANIALPAAFNNSSTARLRFYYYNATGGITPTGSRPKISIDNITVTAVATTPCAAPTAPATNLVFGTTTDVSIGGSFTAANPASDNYLVIASTNSSLTSNPVNGQHYVVGDNVGDGTVVSYGSANSFTANNLSASTAYYFFVFPVNAVCTGGPLYFTNNVLTDTKTTNAGLPPCAAPAAQPSSLVFGTTTINSIQGSFTATTADEYLVVRSTSATLSSNPVTGTVYSTGDALGGGVVVQKGAATNFTANGLTPNTPYYFFVFSLNSQSCINGPVYNVTAALAGSQSTMPLPPCTSPTMQPVNLSLKASTAAVAGNFAPTSSADAYLIVRSLLPTLSAAPTNNQTYAIGDNLGGGTVVANGTNNSFLSAGLTAGTTYYFFIFAANENCSNGPLYLGTSPLTSSITTANAVTYNYYFGTLHSHSDYSDGNQDRILHTPTEDYNFAMTAQCMDFLGISEHNHFSSPDNPGNIITNYHSGLNEANAFSAAHSSFLALYGMEWGVISGGGHVVVYGNEMNNLFGWESGSGEWGPTNNYDVYVAKNDYTGANGLFKTINDFVANKTFGTLAHPNLTDFNNLANVAYNAVADSAITGVAVESGPATTTNTTYSNPGSSMSYLWYYQTLLAKGYHLGPTIDHDNHNTTFGKTTYSRTAVVSPTLLKADVINSMRNMHFYATQDCDTKVDFQINTQIMGSVFTDRYAPVISVTLTDATTNTSTAIIRLMYGQPGSGVMAAKLDSVIGNSMTYIDNSLANLSTGYYYIDVINGTSRVVTAPIWYSRNDNNGNPLPIKLIDFTATKQGSAVSLNWRTAEEINTKDFVLERSADGQTFKAIGVVAASGNSASEKSYQYLDNQPLSGNNFYRLRSVDNDGKASLSKVAKVAFGKTYLVTILPNPAKGSFTVTSSTNEPINLQIVDLNGRVVKTQRITNTIEKVTISNLTTGIYTVKMMTATGMQTQKLIIQ